MDTSRFQRISDTEWRVKPRGKMRVPAVIFATEDLIRGMDDKDVAEVVNAADEADLARKVAKLVPLICVKG